MGSCPEMPTIPHDVWLNVAQFIPALVLRDLLTINSSFFDIAMDCRYRQMSFAYLDNRMLRSLARLKDPAVAKRVRILHVYPGFLKEALDREKSEPALRRSLRYRLADLGNLLIEQTLFPKSHGKYRGTRAVKRTEDVVQVMLEVLSGLPNVTDYYVTWCGLPSIGATASPFLSTIFQSKPLRKLSLTLSLDNVQNLLSPSFQVHNLEQLQLCIRSENASSAEERSDILVNHLAPAITNLPATLQIFTLQALEPVDLSPLFRAIDLPVLQELSLIIPVEPIHLGDPAGLSEFLKKHKSTLRTLRLRLNQCSGPGLTPDLTSFNSWIRSAISHVKLPKLSTLDVSSNLFPVETALSCLRHFASTITTLTLTGSYRTYEDVEQALNLVSSTRRDEPLTKLRIGLVALSPQLVDLIAAKLPKLDRLDIIVRYFLPHATDTPLFHKDMIAARQCPTQLDDFLDKMHERRYPDWQLRHMSLFAERLPCAPQHSGRDYQPLFESAFMGSIPSIRTYA